MPPVVLFFLFTGSIRGGTSARMPKVFIKDGYKFFFFSNEGKPLEPMHIHVRKAEAVAKFWMYPEVRLENAYSFSSKELKWLEKEIEMNRKLIEDTWNGYFNQ